MSSSLSDALRAAGAVFAPDQGADVAIEVSGKEVEYRAVREKLGIGDFSDLGKIRVAGEEARALLDRLLTGNIRNMPENAIRHTMMLDESGKFVTDVTVYAGFDDYLLLVDRSHVAAFLTALRQAGQDDVTVEQRTDEDGVLRIDGPDCADIPRQLIGLDGAGLRIMSFITAEFEGHPLTIGRIGSVGEYGYQFIAPRAGLPGLLNRLRVLTKDGTLCGRSVYDVLQLEMRSFNARRDMPRGESPLEAGLHWMIDFRKEEFVGRAGLMASKEAGLRRRQICFCVGEGGALPATGASVHLAGQLVGYVAHAAWSWTLARAIGLAYLDTAVAAVGLPIDISTDDGMVQAESVSAPFVRTRSNTMRR